MTLDISNKARELAEALVKLAEDSLLDNYIVADRQAQEILPFLEHIQAEAKKEAIHYVPPYKDSKESAEEGYGNICSAIEAFHIFKKLHSDDGDMDAAKQVLKDAIITQFNKYGGDMRTRMSGEHQRYCTQCDADTAHDEISCGSCSSKLSKRIEAAVKLSEAIDELGVCHPLEDRAVLGRMNEANEEFKKEGGSGE